MVRKTIGLFILIFISQGFYGQLIDRSTAFEFNRNLGKGVNYMAAKVDGRYFHQRDAEILVENHFSHIRLGAKLNKYHGTAPEFTVDADRIQDLLNYVNILIEQGLMVVLDPIHQYNEEYSDADLPVLKKIWEQISLAFADYPTDKLCFEIMNEPHDDYNLFNIVNESLAVIRSVPGNEQRIVIASGQGFSTRQALIDAFNNDIFPANDPYLIGTFHYYDPRKFTKQGTFEEPLDWGADGDSDPEWKEVSDAFDEVVSANNNWAERNNTTALPLYLGEFGVDNATAFADRMRWLWWIRNEAEKRSFSHALWNMYNDNPSSKGIGPWTSVQKEDPYSRYLESSFVEALIGRYECEDGLADPNIETISGDDTRSGLATLLEKQGEGIEIADIYIGKTGTYQVYIRYKLESTDSMQFVVKTKKSAEVDFQNEEYTYLHKTNNKQWGHIYLHVAFSTPGPVDLRFEILEDGPAEFDFLAISSGKFYQNQFPSEANITNRIESQMEKSGVLIYPNPHKSFFFIENGQQTTGEYTLFDFSGKIMDSGVLEPGKSKIRYSSPPGIYFLKVEIERTNSYFTISKL